MTVLVISSKVDAHITWVTDHLDQVGHPWVRLNTEDFATNVTLTIAPSSGRGTVQIADSGKTLALTDVKSVWYRKPEPLELAHFELERAGLDYVEAEFNEVVQGLYALLQGVKWVNNPLTTKLTHRKPFQLKIASLLGLQTPRTLISNSEPDVLEFARSLDGDLAIKSLSSLSVTSRVPDTTTQYGLFTRRVTKGELSSISSHIPHMPTVYQEYVEKLYELRVTMVGQKCFACKIESQNTEFGKEDFRIDTQAARHTAYELPADIVERLKAYMAVMHINFGCFDIIRAVDGSYVFVECNPNGQWLWIEKEIKAGIPAAIAQLLVTGTVTPAVTPN